MLFESDFGCGFGGKRIDFGEEGEEPLFFLNGGGIKGRAVRSMLIFSLGSL